MRVHVYEPHYNEKHQTVLRALAQGIEAAGEEVVLRDVRDAPEDAEADVAVLFGGVKLDWEPTWAKRAVLDRYSGRRLLVVESAFVRRGKFWQVGWGGSAGHADFRTAHITENHLGRWQSFGVKTKPWQRRSRGPVVVCGQLPRDTQVQDVDHVGWCRRTVELFRRRGEEVWFRPHPRQRDESVYGLEDRFVRVDFLKLKKTLGTARCFVTWNSTSGVDAVLAGVPVIACDPGSMAWPVAAHRPEDFPASLRFPSRRQWLARLAYSQWTLEEMRAGLPWLHLTGRLEVRA